MARREGALPRREADGAAGPAREERARDGVGRVLGEDAAASWIREAGGGGAHHGSQPVRKDGLRIEACDAACGRRRQIDACRVPDAQDRQGYADEASLELHAEAFQGAEHRAQESVADRRAHQLHGAERVRRIEDNVRKQKHHGFRHVRDGCEVHRGKRIRLRMAGRGVSAVVPFDAAIQACVEEGNPARNVHADQRIHSRRGGLPGRHAGDEMAYGLHAAIGRRKG